MEPSDETKNKEGKTMLFVLGLIIAGIAFGVTVPHMAGLWMLFGQDGR